MTVGYVDSESDEVIDLGTYTLAFADQQTNQVPPGVYRLEFRQPANSTTGSTCTFDAVNGAVAIAKAGEAPTDAEELFIPTSSLCLD